MGTPFVYSLARGDRSRVLQERVRHVPKSVGGGELQLPPLAGVLLGRHHDAGVVDEDVEKSFPGRRQRDYGCRFAQLERRDSDVVAAASPFASSK
jgi:hypothetical protein